MGLLINFVGSNNRTPQQVTLGTLYACMYKNYWAWHQISAMLSQPIDLVKRWIEFN